MLLVGGVEHKVKVGVISQGFGLRWQAIRIVETEEQREAIVRRREVLADQVVIVAI